MDPRYPRRTVDLSVPLDPDLQVYPGDPAVEFRPAATVAGDGYNLLAVRMGSQSGTHCDAPRHFLDSGAPIDEVPLEYFAGPAVLVDVRGLPARSPIGPDRLAPNRERLRPGVLVLLHTGWSRHRGGAGYFAHPYLSAAACRELLERGVRTIGLDAPSIDETPDGTHPGEGYPAHHLIAAAGGVIVENLTGLERIDFPDPFVCVHPLRLTGADGAPARAVALDFGPSGPPD
jgi:kynurenine formamidase